MTLVTGDAGVGGTMPQGPAEGFLTVLCYSDNEGAAGLVVMALPLSGMPRSCSRRRKLYEIWCSVSADRIRQ
jgi:hypothetical protein